MNSMIIDIIFVIFFIIMAIVGYKKGFVIRLYDLLTLILVICLSIWLSSPLSHVFTIYQYNPNDYISMMIGVSINMFLVFICLFVVLFIMKTLIGIAVKPILKKIVDFFSLTETIDGLLGVILSVVEALFISYIVVLLCITPLISQGKQMINNTLITQHVLKMVPSMSETIMNMDYSFEDIQSTSFNQENLVEMILIAEDFNILTDEQIATILNEYVYPQLKEEKITLTTDQIDQVRDILNSSSIDQKIVKDIMSKIDVGDR